MNEQYQTYLNSEHWKHLRLKKDWRLMAKLSATARKIESLYEDRLEEIRMALNLERPKSNPYEVNTIEYRIWELRQDLQDLRKENRKLKRK